MSRESAGAAIRTLRESRDWSLADLAEATGVSVMGLSYLERGARKPHKGTVQKVENGLGLPPGTYAQLVLSPDPKSDVQALLPTLPTARRTHADVVVDRSTDTAVFEGFAEAQIEALNTVIDRLPPAASFQYESIVVSVLAQCAKAQLLAANSWRVAVGAGAGPSAAAVLLGHVQTLEATRQSLLARLDSSLPARFDRACRASGLPTQVIAALTGITTDELWTIRAGGAVPADAAQRVRVFSDTAADSAVPAAAIPN